MEWGHLPNLSEKPSLTRPGHVHKRISGSLDLFGGCHKTRLWIPATLSSVTVGSQISEIPADTPLVCLLKNLSPFCLKGDIRPKHPIFYSLTAWPGNKLDNGSQRPEFGTFNFQIPRDLDNCLQRNGQRQAGGPLRPSFLHSPRASFSFPDLLCPPSSPTRGKTYSYLLKL